MLGVKPAVGGKERLNRGHVCILMKDFRWINEVVKVKVKIKFVEVRVIENMEFNVDLDPNSAAEDQTSWVSKTSLYQSSADSL